MPGDRAEPSGYAWADWSEVGGEGGGAESCGAEGEEMTQTERERLASCELRLAKIEMTLERLFEALVGGFDVMRHDLEEVDPRR